MTGRVDVQPSPRWTRRPIARLTMGVAALGLVVLAVACTPPPPEPVAPVAPVRDLPVSTTELDLVDPTRATPPFDGYPGDPTRALPTTVWYPTERHGPYPLVVFAHGFGVAPDFYGALLPQIASAGYVVAAPTLPLLSGWPAGPTDTVGWDDEYADLQFVTSAILDAATNGDPVLGDQVDPARIAVMGHSDGALLAFGDGFEAGRTDARVRAVVAFAAYLGGRGTYQANGRALLHFASELDEYNDFGATVDWDHAVLGDPFWTVAVHQATHAGPYTDPGDPAFGVVVATTVDFLDFQLKAGSDAPFVADVVGNPEVVAFV